jgi:hypothetical protein
MVFGYLAGRDVAARAPVGADASISATTS